MQQAQQAQFADRINRIKTGGPNTFSTVYTGLQDVNTPRGKAVSGVTHVSPKDRGPSRGSLMALGLKSGLLQLVGLGSAALLYLKFTGH